MEGSSGGRRGSGGNIISGGGGGDGGHRSSGRSICGGDRSEGSGISDGSINDTINGSLGICRLDLTRNLALKLEVNEEEVVVSFVSKQKHILVAFIQRILIITIPTCFN